MKLRPVADRQFINNAEQVPDVCPSKNWPWG